MHGRRRAAQGVRRAGPHMHTRARDRGGGHKPRKLGLRGSVAQWEGARFTRERSQVRNPPRPSKNCLLMGGFLVVGGGGRSGRRRGIDHASAQWCPNNALPVGRLVSCTAWRDSHRSRRRSSASGSAGSAAGLQDRSPERLAPQAGGAEPSHDRLRLPRRPDDPTRDRQGHPLQPGRPCRGRGSRATLIES
jgi:hypothetical protein